MKKTKNHKQASDFWMEDYFDPEHHEKGDDIMELSSYRRAVANFVRIVTGDNIPVKFSTGNDSYTNGKEVTISASTKLQDRDSMVGLALHEGSHVKLTDFKLLYRLGQYWNEFEALHGSRSPGYVLSEHNWFTINGYTEQISQIQGYDGPWYTRLRDMTNYVEDRRIDAFIAETAPGYRPYYQALYDKYFNAKVIGKGLQSAEYRTEDWESYLFRLLNITNPKRDLKALQQLELLWQMLDLKNISRLGNTDDAAKLAFEMMHVIATSIAKNKPKQPDDNQSSQSPKEQQQSSNNGRSPISSDDDDHDLPNSESMEAEGPGGGNPGTGDEDDEVDATDSDTDTDDDLDSLSPNDRNQLRKKIEEQKQMVAGQLKKKRISKKITDMINSIDDSNISIENVCTGIGNFRVTVVRAFNRKLAETVDGGMWRSTPDRRITDVVNTGIQQGTVLGKKLKVRAEERTTQFNRQRTGKIDKRMIHTAGFGNETIFDRIEKFSYRPGIIHISIDNSGSMGGRKYQQAIQTAAAIAKACSMIPNLDCVINMRSTGSISGNMDTAMIVIAYDSRKQSINEMRVLLPYIWCCGSTPEGLCFDAIMEEVIKSANGKDAFFLNFSDGAPYYYEHHNGKGGISYSGKEAHLHTRRQVQKMAAEGIHVLSYYISEGSTLNPDCHDACNFREMYGKDSQFINVQDINAIAKTINNKFLEVA